MSEPCCVSHLMHLRKASKNSELIEKALARHNHAQHRCHKHRSPDKNYRVQRSHQDGRPADNDRPNNDRLRRDSEGLELTYQRAIHDNKPTG